ncbi:MAG TPA: ABC transporter permease, partial [Chitinophaga sp.]
MNYCKIGWRNLWHNKGYSAINIFGLGLGMAVALIIGLWVVYEWEYDKFFPGYRQAAQVMITVKTPSGAHSQSALALPVKEELKKVSGIQYVAESNWPEPGSLIVGNRKLYLPGMGAGEDFLHILDYPLLAGDRATCLREPYSIVLSASAAHSLFGNADPLGRMVKVDNQYNMTVTGVLKDVPANATVTFSFLVPFTFLERTRSWMNGARVQWPNNSFQLWAGLRPGANLETVNRQVAHTYLQSHDENMKDFITFLHPASRWHLYGEFRNGQNTGGFIDYVRMFCLIGGLVLLIACINFMNLATARSDKRAREVGVRKAVGSGRREIIFQFLTESFLLTVLAFLFALVLTLLVLPWFNKLAACNICIPFGNGWCWLAMGGYMLVTGLLAGSRPAFYLSSFAPVKVLKGTLKTGEGSSLPRRMLVVLQFASSVALIIAAGIIYQQIRYAQQRPKGYNAVRLVTTDNTADLNKNYQALRADLLASGVVENVTLSGNPATWVDSHSMVESWPGKATVEKLPVGLIGIDRDYFSTMGMQLKEGHNFLGESHAADSLYLILNEAAVKAMALKDPVGKLVRYWAGSAAGPVVKEGMVIAVVKDAILESPYTPVSPALFLHGSGGSYVLYRLSDKVSPVEAIR